jgi:anti-sigma factor RsiW
MTLIADEILMAYADGELEPKARGEVIEALMRDPEVVLRLDVFLSTRTSLARLYQAPMHESVPERFVRLFADGSHEVDVCSERGAWLRRLKFFVGLGTGCMLHGATVSPLNSPPSV